MTEYSSLQELTGQESGIIVYGVTSLGGSMDGAEAIIGNWSSIDGLPRLDPLGITLIGLHETFTATESPWLQDIGAWLAMENGKLPGGINLIYDRNDDLKDLPGTPGGMWNIYQSGEEIATVIAPEGWA